MIRSILSACYAEKTKSYNNYAKKISPLTLYRKAMRSQISSGPVVGHSFICTTAHRFTKYISECLSCAAITFIIIFFVMTGNYYGIKFKLTCQATA